VNKGYFRYPTLFADQVAFTSEDDIWLVPLSGGIARRLTAGLGTSSRPHFSPDGKKLAFSSAEEGALEVFIMPAEGGEVQRLTYLANQSHVVGWQDNETVFFASPAFEPHLASTICRIATSGGLPESQLLACRPRALEALPRWDGRQALVCGESGGRFPTPHQP
jgi:tricorn protease